MKMAGILFIVLSCTMTGMRMASGMSDRVRKLELLGSMLEELSHRLSYLQSTMLGLMTSIAAQDRFAELGLAGPCRDHLREGMSFSQAWSASVKAQEGALGAEVSEILLALSILGTTDLASQISAIDCVKELLAERLVAAREERGTKAQLFRTMGVLSGVGIAILLI